METLTRATPCADFIHLKVYCTEAEVVTARYPHLLEAAKYQESVFCLFRLPVSQVIALRPKAATCERNTTIYVSAQTFSPSDMLGCQIGDTVVRATFVSPTLMSCPYAGHLAPGPVEIAITNNGVDFTMAGNMTFLPKSTVTKLTPSSGPLSAMVSVLLEGTGFSVVDTPSCSFGGMIVYAEVLNATRARCITTSRLSSDSAIPILAPVTFSNNGVDFDDDAVNEGGVRAAASFLFYPEPSISSVTPMAGITNGDSISVTVSGANIGIGSSARDLSPYHALLCRLRDRGPATNGTIVSPTAALCEISCGNFTGRASVEISLNNGVHWTESPVGFQCDPLPIVESIWPLLGPISGGTALTISGFGFAPGDSLSCLVGGGGGGGGDNATRIPALLISPSTVKCLTPAAIGDAVPYGPTNESVFVSNDGVHFSWPADTAVFEYVPTPTVQRVIPTFASVAGSDIPLTVKGTNFVNSSSAACRFTSFSTIGSGGDRRIGDLAIDGHLHVVVPSTFLTTTTVLCPVPRKVLSPGSAQLVISVNGVDFDDAAATIIEMEAVPELLKVVPSRAFVGPVVTPVEVSSAVVRRKEGTK